MSDDFYPQMVGKAAFIIQVLLQRPHDPVYRDMAEEWLKERDDKLVWAGSLSKPVKEEAT